MRRIVGLVLFALMSTTLPAWASGHTSVDSCLGPESARTAVEQLGPVRIVVYDPVSNSFAFVSPCSGSSKEELKNRQYLDRQRLALTTQKIRLLILPYNPVDGSLTLQDSRNGQGGIEFAETPIASLPKAQEAKQTAESKPGKAKKPKKPKVDTKAPGQTKPGKAVSAAAAPADPWKAVGDQIDSWNSKLDEINVSMQQLQFNVDCVHEHVQAIPIHISQDLAVGGCRKFSLDKDVSLREVEREAERRTQLVKDNSYKSCFASGSLDDDAKQLEKSFIDVLKEVNELGRDTDKISRLVQKLAGSKPPQGVSPDDWKKQVDMYQQAATAFEDHQKEIEAESKDLSQQIGNTRSDADNFSKILTSSAFQLQRRNYSPLANGESITFVFTRAEVTAVDGKTVVVPKQSNTLEIRSAPVYTIRFGTGIVVSGLRDPSFKVASDPNDSKKKVILFDDQGQNQILPSLFVHHYWGRRSPLLQPTIFERFTPTFSLGIPLAKTDILQQVLFGLDWELVPGLELNLGAHWGKVNALNSPYRVNGPEIDSNLDITTIQKKQFRTGFYAGIVVNGDAFTSFFNQRQ